MPAIVHPSPTLTATQSGTIPISRLCSATSRPAVFFPSTSTGLIAQFRLYQPNSWQACEHKSYAASYEDFTAKTVAPKTCNWATFGSGAVCGTKIFASSPANAACPARLLAALPVEAHAIVFAPTCNACATPTELARSLNDAVGLRPSSLNNSWRMPNVLASRCESITGVYPTGQS